MKSSKPAEPTADELAFMTDAHANVLLGRKAMHEQIVNDMCTLFKGDNPLFDEHKFRAAAGYEVRQ